MLRKKISYGLIALLGFCTFFYACDREPEPEIILYDVVNGFAIDNFGVKYLATNIGLVSFDDEQWGVHLVNNTEATILKDIEFFNNEMWLSSNAGAFTINTTSPTEINTTNSCLSDEFVIHFYLDDEDNKYLATSNSVVALKNGKCYEAFGRSNEYSSYEITDIGTTTNNYTYVTMMGGGVGRFSIDEVDGVTGETIMDEDWGEIKNLFVYTVFIEDTIQWYGSENGVAKHYSHYTKEFEDWDNWYASDGLISDTVISIAKDLDGNMWFGTYKGISRFNEESGTWTNFDVNSHNIINDTVKHIAAADGYLWIATDDGLSAYDGVAWTNYSNIDVLIDGE